MAATAIGASHVILSPVAGARFGYDLLWLVLFSHLFKYPAFEFGARFAVATGTSLIRGYERVPGPRNWALIAFLGITILQGLTILSGVIAVAASVLVVNLGTFPFPVWILILGAVIITLHRTGRYQSLQFLSKVLMGILALVTLVAFSAAPPSFSNLTRIFVPSIPPGSAILISSIFGLMPIGINASVWHSLWAVEHLKIWEQKERDRKNILRMGMIDLGVGYGLSIVLAVMFMSLGANLLQPRGLTPNGIDVALTLSTVYTELLGAWIYPLFMLAFFAAIFSTTYSVMDGFPRAFSTILRRLLPDNDFVRRESNPTYWIFMLVIFAFALLANTLLPNPVLMVSLVGVLSLMLAPILYSLNYFCVTRLIDDHAFRPSRLMRAWAIAGILFMTLAGCFYIYTELYLKNLAN